MLAAISWLVVLAGGLVAAYCVWTYVKVFATETGSTWAKLLSASRDSATILVSKLAFIVSGTTMVVDKVSTQLGDPGLVGQIQPYLTPRNVAIASFIMFALNVWARLRTLEK